MEVKLLRKDHVNTVPSILNDFKKDLNNKYKNNTEGIFIDIVPFGTDGIDDLTPREIVEIFRDKEGIVVGLLKQLNFNSDKNTHHNIFFSHMKDGWDLESMIADMEKKKQPPDNPIEPKSKTKPKPKPKSKKSSFSSDSDDE